MGHYGKHIIDPETGLCEICDKNAIQEFRQSKRPGNPYRHEASGSPIGSYVRRSAVPPPLPQPPPPPVQPRRVIYEDIHQEPLPTRRIVRHEPPPPQEVIVHRPSPRPPTIVYVDKENPVIPQYTTSIPTRAVHVIAQTPPPPASDIWYSGPRRQINSGIEVLRQQPRIAQQIHYQPSPRNPPGPQYVQVLPNLTRHASLNAAPVSRGYPVDANRKQYRLEPLPRKIYTEPEPTVLRKVYQKLPPGRHEPVMHRTFITPQPIKEPPVYHIRSSGNY